MKSRELVRQKIADTLGRDSQFVVDELPLSELVTSSFILVELFIELQEEFGIRFNQADVSRIVTVRQLLDLVDNRIGTEEVG